jgi:Putative Flp pilus-assembly TadE/G-like
MRQLRSESGQVIPLVGVVLMAVLLGVCALAIDMGVWFKASRSAQNVADAAALAGVQDLPGDPGGAVADANAYADQNDGTIDTPVVSGNTISVRATETAPAIFARVLGIESETVHATASAEADGVGEIPGSGFDGTKTGEPIPFAIAQGTWQSTPLDQETSLCWGPCDKIGAGQFGLVDFAGDGSHVKDVGNWLENGYPGTLSPGTYSGIPGNGGFSANKDDIYALAGKTITLPVYTGNADGSYDVVGWAAFVVDAVPHAGGDWTQLDGHFITLDVPPTTTPAQYFGVGHVKLTK